LTVTKKKQINWRKTLVFISIGLLVAVTTPRFIKMLENSKNGSAKGNLGILKSAASIYYGDTHGIWPSTLDVLVPKYLESIPKEPINGSQKVVGVYDGTGGWVYNNQTGEIRPNFISTSPK
jgi:hypothetical protein